MTPSHELFAEPFAVERCAHDVALEREVLPDHAEGRQKGVGPFRVLTCPRSFFQLQLEPRGFVRRLMQVEQWAFGGAGCGSVQLSLEIAELLHLCSPPESYFLHLI
jgi:hypothetical protein